MPERSKGADLRSAVFVRVGSNPTRCNCSHGLMVMTPDFESGDQGSIPCESFKPG